VVIKRDKWGIPHIFGETDNATAFGLAYAHAEDDFPLIQGSLVAARGKLAQLKLARISIINDYLVQLLDIPAHTDRQHQVMPEKFRLFLDAYAEVASWAIHQYGNVNRKESPHYDDQAPLFIKRKMRPSLLTAAAIQENLEKAYHPGQEMPAP
jgi:acyl-homoserine lactone acylase PvdQ